MPEIASTEHNNNNNNNAEGLSAGRTESTNFMFKKKSKKKSSETQTRKRTIDGDDEIDPKPVKKTESQSEAQSQQVVKSSRKKNRTAFLNPLCQATSSSKRLKTAQDSSDDDDDDSEDDLNDNENDSKRVGVSYKAQGSARQQAEENRIQSMTALKEQSKDPIQTTQDPKEDGGQNIYHGNASSKYQLPKGSLKYGPIKGGPNNIKTITVVDYQPDVCKDYKETGYCGFGDTCKFLHDRGDYMHGWQLDDAFNSSRDKKNQAESEEEEEVPFACLICRKPFTDPIVTKCQHYYCSGCAIKRFAKTPKCFACGAPTGGIFNKATRIIEKLKLKQERIQKQKEERRIQEEGLTGIEGLEDQPPNENGDDQELGSERSFYEDE